MNKNILLPLGAIVLIAFALLIWQKYFVASASQDLDGNFITDQELFFNNGSISPSANNLGEPPQEKILITNGIKHSVPLDEIISGGVEKDGIPPIDNPEFVSVAEADEYLDPNGLGIGIVRDGLERYYPFQILVWHEIVNDIINGQRVLITYCPLCGTGIVFDPVVNGTRVEFGVSGKLYNSDLVMYDRLTDSYWSQIEGKAIVGEMTRAKLELLPADNVTWADWKRDHPQSQVLSRDTGYIRDYDRNPYGNYNASGAIYFPVDNQNDQLHPKDWVYGVEVNGAFKAYRYAALNASGSFEDNLGGQELTVNYDSDRDVITVYDAETGEEITGVRSFWFAWYAFHPGTDLYNP
ncbi:MAG: hypothetical protein COT81_02055 [Candidatus Buchananbacteria bacterium CG10_big_fil_rev_8_21_14_0_10_42_9]|uniref:DUF3179 domain-containing protein n=1 Tax=Candidatus Buchananbacteria bacterium CG10_big_fil_rev_8_21_14_0_10_42_9 TaxID=1974526 RepID=A0A2H0W3Z6_9BACT|nr:MAG: hypothetical protein COT81_02055 [Candidatus Buchananbacteria bacterium CG10_big_fil_rev_8_21_14_0_10_42_9]